MRLEKAWRWLVVAGSLLSTFEPVKDVFAEPANVREPVKDIFAERAKVRERVAIVFADGIDGQLGVVRDLPLELQAEGFEVRMVGKESDETSFEAWTERARSAGVRAVIHVVRGEAGEALVDVLIVAPDAVLLRNAAHYRSGDTTGDLASVRAVEVMRAALLETEAPQPLAFETTLPAPDEKNSRRLPRFAASLVPALMLAGHPRLVSLDIGLGLGFMPSDDLALELGFAFPVLHASEQWGVNPIRAGSKWLDAGISYFFLPRSDAVRPFINARAGVLFLGSDFAEKSPVFFSAVAAGLSLRLHRFLRLRIDAAIGFTAPKVIVNFDRTESSLLLFSLGPEVLW